MAQVFLDANYFIDIIEQRKTVKIDQFLSNRLYLSPLSVHIFVYLYKKKTPNMYLLRLLNFFTIVAVDEEVMANSLKGPTDDFEDNLQLHSAAVSSCDYFLTNDKKLLSMRFFGKTKIVYSLS